jgi:hypothetical protein
VTAAESRTIQDAAGQSRIGCSSEPGEEGAREPKGRSGASEQSSQFRLCFKNRMGLDENAERAMRDGQLLSEGGSEMVDDAILPGIEPTFLSWT